MCNQGPRVIVVTGGSRGIGRQIVWELVHRGNLVAIISRRPTQDISLRKIIDGSDSGVVEFSADVGDQRSVCAVIAQVLAKWGRIDGLVNNAGQKVFDEFIEITPDRFSQTVQTNLLGPYHLCHAVVPVMLEQHYGRIINIASRAGMEFYGTSTAYSASKAGLIGFSQCLADALRGTGVTVNVLCPPTVVTEEYLHEEPKLDTRGLLQVEVVVRVAIELLSEQSDVTGQAYPFYSPRSYVRAVLRSAVQFAAWFAQLRYRKW